MIDGFPVTVQSPRQESAVIKWVLHDAFSREDVLIASTANDAVYEIGTVLAQVTASGKWVPVNPAGADGSQTAAAVLAKRAFVPAGVDMLYGAIRRFAIVNPDALIWPAGITAPQITAAVAQLAAINILANKIGL